MRKNNKVTSSKSNTMVSKASDKKSDVLIQIDELMADLENEYSPLMIKELQKRIIKTISDFKNDLESVLKEAFEKHDDRCNKLEDVNYTESEDSNDNMPSFIAEYEQRKKEKNK